MALTLFSLLQGVSPVANSCRTPGLRRAFAGYRLFTALIIGILGSASWASAQPGIQVLHKHLPAQVSEGRATLVGSLPPDQELSLSIVLPLRHPQDLTSLLTRLYNPSDPDYRNFLSVAQFTERFGPTIVDYTAVVNFAHANGLVVTGAPANRLVVPVRGSVDQISKAFHVTMNLYRHPTEDRVFFSPDREPSLELAVPVAHISGLNNFSLPQPMLRRSSQASPSVTLTGTGPSGSYLGSDMRAAYYGGTTLDGNGQTVGILEFGGYDVADVDRSFSDAGQSYIVPIQNVLLDGATGLTVRDDAEQVLDIVQVIGMAPGLSQVRVYIGQGNDDANLLNSMASENLAKVLSCSWSWTPDDPTVDDPFFLEFAAQGQSFLTASGDEGAFDYSISPFYYPQEDANVTAVGGTHLTTNGPGGTWASETAWNSHGFGSGGGISPDGIAIPVWQTGVATAANGGSTTLRNVPDVAMEGDFDNYACFDGVCANDFAGTSFAAPRWAGFMALVNQQAVEAGTAPKGGIGFLNSSIYALGKGKRYGTDFHDITAGNNDTNNQTTWFNAGSKYDLVTGWGSATGQPLIDDLAGKQVPGFWLGASPRSVGLAMGGSASTTITVTDAGGFSGNVTLALTSALPAGVTASWGTNPTSGASVLTLTASATAPASSTTLVVTGTSGKLTATTTIKVTIHAPTFDLLTSVGYLQILPGGSVTAAVTVTPEYGFTGNVQLTVSGLPSGVTASFSPNPATGNSTLTFTATATVVGGQGTLTIKGTSGSQSVTKSLFLVVAAPTFTLVAPQSLNVGQGVTTSTYISIYPEFGFVGTVSLTATGLPSGVTASFSPNPTQGSSLLTITTSATAALGTTPITIHGASGNIRTAVTLPLGIFTPTFTIGVPTSAVIGQGTSTTLSVQANQLYGFTGNINLSASGLPSGVSASFSPNPTTGFTTLTLTAAASVALGTTAVTVTGTSGSITASATFPLSVFTPTFALYAGGAVSVGQGTSSTNYVYVLPKYNFSGFVNLSLTGLPAGVTASFSPNPTNGMAVLTLTCSSTASLGTTAATLTGTYGSLKVTAPLTVGVFAQKFSLETLPTLTIGKGTSSTLSIAINPQYGFTGSVNFSVSGLPAGVTASFSPNPAVTQTNLTLTATSAAALGANTITVTGTSGNLSSSTTFALVTHVPSFTLTAQQSASVGQGASNRSYVNVIPVYGFTGSVSLRASGLPSGVTASFSPNPTNGLALLTLTASSSAVVGDAKIAIIGISGTQTRSIPLVVSVSTPTFTISSMGSLDIGQGTTTTSYIYLTLDPGLTGAVNLSVAGLPSGVTASFSPNPSTGESTLTLTASSTASLGSSTVTLSGTSGAKTVTTTFPLVVHAPTFTFGGLGDISVCQGTTITNSLFIQSQYGFTGSARLTFSGLPSGVTGSFSPNPTNGDTEFTLTASSAAATGTRTVKITGASGALTASTTFHLTVCTPSFTLTSYSSGATVTPGGSTTSYLYVNSQTGFMGSVQLAVSGLPSGVTAAFSPNPTVGQSILTLTASSAVALGTQNLTITGTSGTATASTQLPLTVATPTFTLSSYGDYILTRGTRSSTYINVNPLNGFTGNVKLAISGLPSGLTGTFSPNPTSGQSILTLVSSNATPAGVTAVSITGTSGALSASTTFNLTVYPPAFTIDTFATGSIPLGGSATSYVYISSQTGFASPVKLAVSGLPSGVSGSFSPNPTVNGSSVLTLRASDAANLGEYTVTVTGTSLGQTVSTPLIITIDAPSFSLYGAGSSVLGRGASTSTYVYIRPQPGFTGSVYLALRGLPNGVSASFSQNPVTQYTLLTLTASSVATLGQYTVNLVGTSGTQTVTWPFSLGIYPSSFTLASDGQLDLGPGTSASAYVSVRSNYGFNGSVKLSASGLPAGVTASFSSNPTVNGYSNLTLQASSAAIPGQYPVTITGSSGSLSASTTISVRIYAPSFMLNGPYQVTLGRGNSTTSYASFYPQYGFTGNVTFALAGLPNGVTAAISPNPSTGQSDITFYASKTASLGQYLVTLTATSGTLSQSTTFAMAVYTPTFTLYGLNNIDMGRGTSVTTGLQVNAEYGFTGNVTLSALNLPSGVTASISPNPTSNGASVITLTAANTAALGQTYVTFKGTYGTQTSSTALALGIYVPTFTVYPYGSTISMNRGASATSYIALNSLYGFNSLISLTVTGLPSGVTASFSPASTTGGISVLSLKASATAVVGQYSLTVTGTSGSQSSSAPLTLNVL